MNLPKLKIRFLLMTLTIISFSVNLIPFICYADTPIHIISVYGTSSSEDSKPVTDLLDLKKEGSWKPNCKDAGVNEGLFFQFVNPVLIDYIEVKLKVKNPNRSILMYYLDGKRIISLKQKQQKSNQNNQVDELEYWSLLKPQGNYFICRFGMRDGFESLKPLNTKIQSIFIRIAQTDEKPEIISVRFFQKNSANPLPVDIPKNFTGSVTATSTLAPTTAYNVSNLFDSQFDFAWATDGKKTTGIGESVTIDFDKSIKLSGLMLWNGYQRSSTHYYANSRASEIQISINGQKMCLFSVKDQMGVQELNFPQALEAKQLKITINKIYPGKTYKDMVLSELKLVDANGNIVILSTKPTIATYKNPLLEKMVDSAIVNYMGWLSQEQQYRLQFENTVGNLCLRIRSNHSFVLYYNYGSEVLEGNWEEQADVIRIFGKRYTTNPRDSMYLRANKEQPEVEIFQSNIKLIDSSSLTYEEMKGYLKTILAERGYYKVADQINPAKPILWRVDTKNEVSNIGDIQGTNEEQLLKRTYDFAVKQKALLLVSPLFTDLFLSTNKVDYYVQGYEEEGP